MATTTLDHTLQPCPAGTTTVFGCSDRLSHEIFSILESKFLFGAPPELLGGCSSAGRVRVLSIDGGADGGALAAAALVRLERKLQDLSGNADARVADFFDLAAGSGAGGFLAAALFGRRMPADAARDVVVKNRKVLSGRGGGRCGGLLFRRPEAVFRKVFGDLTVRDAAKPLLIPCYDMATAAPFVFSRADAVEAEAFAAASESAAAASPASVEEGIEVLQAYSKEVSRRLLELAKSRAAQAAVPAEASVKEEELEAKEPSETAPPTAEPAASEE